MAVCCSAKQVAEAVLIRSSNNFSPHVLCLEKEDIEELKCLDLFLSTLDVFSDAFCSIMKQSHLNHQEETFLSKQNFIKYLKPRALLLTVKNGHFDFMLTCTYFSVLLKTRAFSHKCFHFARVACKLLTSVLEERFTEIFKTDDGWGNLMSYCRNIHAVVYPSETNRPIGYEPYPKTRSDNDEGEGQELCESISLESASYHRSTENTYWKYFKLESSTICKRITENRQHLEDVNKLLIKLGQDMDTNWISSDKYDVHASDDEYIEQLERSIPIEAEIRFSNTVKDCFAREICENENGNQVRPEDITSDEVMVQISNIFAEEDHLKCELCDDRMHAFINNWERSFCERYSNSAIVTDVIVPVPEEFLHKLYQRQVAKQC